MAPLEMQKAVVVEKVGHPVVLTERPVPTPKEGEILVKVTVAGRKYDP